MNENKKEILFGECKWKRNVDGNLILRELKEKTNYFEWSYKYKESEKYYLIIAKSFKKKTIEKNVYYFDLNSLEKLLK